MAERFADGLATREELRQSYQITRETPADDEGDFDPAAEGEDYDEFCVPWPSNSPPRLSKAESSSVPATFTSHSVRCVPIAAPC